MNILFATSNPGKVDHAQNILSNCEFERLDVETIEPQSGSIEEIAESKVRQAAEKIELKDDEFLIADDSGLFVEELNGFPGPLSSPFDKKVGKEKLLDLVDESAEAEFRAAIAIYTSGGETKVFKGKAEGEIVEPRGSEGFGYDPMFLPEGNDRTWGENPDFKDESSHREEALIKLKELIES